MRLARGWGPVLVYGKGAKEAQNPTGPRRSPGSFASWGTTRPGDLDVFRLTRTPEPQSANRYGECEVSGETGGPRKEWIAALAAFEARSNDILEMQLRPHIAPRIAKIGFAPDLVAR